MAQVRLQKLLARAGVASRRAAEQLIVEGRVRVDGHTVRRLGSQAAASARIEVDGVGVVKSEPLKYLMLHKPPFVMSTVHDPEGRPTVLDVVQSAGYDGELPRLFPLGRLDFDAEGLLLLSNDGPMMHGLLHPSRHVPKVYTVKVRNQPTPATLAKLTSGIDLYGDDGRFEFRAKAADVRVVRLTHNNAWLELTLLEGRSHQVKRMCKAVGHPVTRLVRTSFAGLELGSLPTGAWRFLTAPETASLQQWMKNQPANRLQKGRKRPTLRIPK